MEELDLEVEFLPSSTILIPSSLITHYNTKIQEHEKHFSIMQYVSGALCRWAENRYMTDKAWRKTATAELKEQRQRDDTERLSKWLNWFTMYNELIE